MGIFKNSTNKRPEKSYRDLESDLKETTTATDTLYTAKSRTTNTLLR